MSNDNKLGLYEHNIESYENVKKQLEVDNVAAIIHATGTGKSFNALQLALDNKDKKIIYIVPNNSIIEHLKELINNNPNLNLENDFPHLEFRTYQSLINLSEDELENLAVDLLILDEFHHIGAPIWGARINSIIESHENIKVFGMTAYTVRDRGTTYERDMTNPETDELFSNKVVSNYDLCDAMIDGILPKPIYRSAYVNLKETYESLENVVNSLNPNSKDYQELSKLLKDIDKRIHEAPGIKDIFKTNIKKSGKYIYFCPIGAEEGKNDIATIIEESKLWVKEMGLEENDYEFYVTTSEMGEEGKKNRDAFYHDMDLENNKVNNKLRIMFAINQYNEGVHAPGLNGVIMGRGTQSDIIFFEQLGRALSVGNNNIEEYDKLVTKSKEELLELCKQKGIGIDSNAENELMIETLLSPVVIDLTNNINFIKNLETQLNDKVQMKKKSSKNAKIKTHLGSASFNIDMINEDLFEILRYMHDRLAITWEDKYKLAKAYYEHHGNLEIPNLFKTINGYEYDENGVALGTWLYIQRQAYRGKEFRKITEEKIELLEEIGMHWDIYTDAWLEKYNLAKAYYEYYGNLEIIQSFKTTNGYEYDENGVTLGRWLNTQRQAYKGHGFRKIAEEKIELLEEIGMCWDIYTDAWMEKYNLAKAYYEYYGNLEIPQSFKTTNGYEYDENGVSLGYWLKSQRQVYKGNGKYKITDERIKLLEDIGIRWVNIDTMDNWLEKYNLAKAYYEYYGNLEIPQSFKTTNGYEYDENGVVLGTWLSTQRQAYRGDQRLKIIDEQIKLLEKIGITWFNDSINFRLQSETIDEKNGLKKQKEVLNRVYSLLNQYDEDSLPSKEEVNYQFIKKLDIKKKR